MSVSAELPAALPAERELAEVFDYADPEQASLSVVTDWAMVTPPPVTSQADAPYFLYRQGEFATNLAHPARTELAHLVLRGAYDHDKLARVTAARRVGGALIGLVAEVSSDTDELVGVVSPAPERLEAALRAGTRLPQLTYGQLELVYNALDGLTELRQQLSTAE